MDIQTLLKEKADKVAAYIMESLPQKEPSLLYELMREYPLRGGKRLRSALCLLACEMFGGREEDALLTAAAFDHFQSAVLIHDDIEDASEERRGKPTLHKMHGIPLSINAGDGLYAIMLQVLADNASVVGNYKAVKIIGEFSKMFITAVEGQAREMGMMHTQRWDLTEADYYKITEAKTAWYTIITPCRSGAIIGSCPEKQLDAFIPFGLKLGAAFQIQDDVLNLVGDTKYGKEIAGDIYEGKRTLMLIHLLEHCTPEERSTIIYIMNKAREDKEEEEVLEVLSLMKTYKSIDYAKKAAKELAKDARTLFDEAFVEIPEGEAKKAIRAVVDFVIKRDY